MTREEFKSLKPGDIIRRMDRGTEILHEVIRVDADGVLWRYPWDEQKREFHSANSCDPFYEGPLGQFPGWEKV